MSSIFRIAFGGVFIECNHFGGLPATMSMFEQHGVLRGSDLLQMQSGVIGGMLAALESHSNEVQPIPLLYASACACGPVTDDCYIQLKAELLQQLDQDGGVDGVLLPLHGAAVTQSMSDLEGDLIASVRQSVGPNIPIVVALDLHAHITEPMVTCADAIVAWKTYPHRDAYETGQRGARLLMDILTQKCRPTMAMAKVPVITSAIHGCSEGNDPFAKIMRKVDAVERRDQVLSASAFLVHPYLDAPEMGSGGLVITNDDLDLARSLATQLAKDYWTIRHELEPTVWSPRNAIENHTENDSEPVLMVETADCCGGGAAGDSVAVLKVLIELVGDRSALVPVVDPAAAKACHFAGVGNTVQLTLGHRLDSHWGDPLSVVGQVQQLSDGCFHYRGGIWDGEEADMGPSAVLRIGRIDVLISSRATYDWMDEQYRSLNLEPAKYNFIVVKNPMNFRMAYSHLVCDTYILNTPGPTPATVKQLNFKKLKRPFFPLDRDIPGLQPTLLSTK